MNEAKLKLGLTALVMAALGALAGYGLALQRLPANPPAPAANPTRQPLYWYDPMVPNQHFDKPGKSPFMDMQLVPKYADEADGKGAGVRIDPGVRQNLGIRLVKVESLRLARTLDLPASVQFNERDVAIVQARTGGFVERVYDRAPGDVVPAGSPLADVLVPEWAAAQTEFLALQQTGDASLREAARTRLRLSGMPASLIAQVEQRRKVQAVATITAPIAGAIQTLDVRAGMTLMAGQTLARINGTSMIWLEAAVPEVQAGSLSIGMPAEARMTAFPGETFAGKVVALLPEANADSRTLRLRVSLPNPKGRLKAGMYAQLQLVAGETESVLQLPSEAIIRTGKRNVVITALDGGRFQPVEVELGSEQAGKTEIRQGVQAGQQVVASGQFLIDSEASLSGVLTTLKQAGTTPQAKDGASSQYVGTGKVETMSADEITLSHDPIPALGWGAMTMPFQLAKSAQVSGIRVGDRVRFEFTSAGGEFVIQRLSKPGAQP